MATRVNPNLFPRAWIGSHKPLPSKKTITEYSINFEEAFSDMVKHGDSTYLKRLLLDAKEHNVRIKDFRSLKLTSFIESTRISAYLYVKENKASVRISVRSYHNIDIDADRIIQSEFKMPEGVQKKVEQIHLMLKEISKACNE